MQCFALWKSAGLSYFNLDLLVLFLLLPFATVLSLLVRVCTTDRLAGSLFQEDLCSSASFYPYADGGFPNAGGVSPQWSMLKYHLWNLGPGYYIGQLEELLILNRPCRPGEDITDSVLPQSYWQEWKQWKDTKEEIDQGYPGRGYLVCR